MSKYKAKKTIVDNITFDSKKEADWYIKLKESENKGMIKNLKRQVEYILIPKQFDENNKFLYHPIKYKSDFEYDDLEGKHHVIDVKGYKTPEFKVKEKLFMYMFKKKIEII